MEDDSGGARYDHRERWGAASGRRSALWRELGEAGHQLHCVTYVAQTLAQLIPELAPT